MDQREWRCCIPASQRMVKPRPGVSGIGHDAVKAVGRQLDQVVLRGHPSGLLSAPSGNDDQRLPAEAPKSLGLRHSRGRLGQFVEHAAGLAGGRPAGAQLPSRLGAGVGVGSGAD
jgi:hypothetical protein